MHKLMLMIALITALAATPALADIVWIGDPIPGGSWGQGFNESGVGPFNRMEVYMDPSVTPRFEVPAFQAFSPAGWIIPSSNEQYAEASGSALYSLNFEIWFTGYSSPQPLAFDFVAWNGSTRVDAAHAQWDGKGENGKWTITAVPDGFSWPLMSASSLIALVGLARRRAKGC